MACHSSCKECSTYGPDFCTACPAGMTHNVNDPTNNNGTCTHTCSLGSYMNGTDCTECSQTISDCEICMLGPPGTNGPVCNLCVPPKKLHNNTCLAECPNFMPSYQGSCYTACPTGTFNMGSYCVDSCPSGTFAESGECMNCHSDCKECSTYG